MLTQNESSQTPINNPQRNDSQEYSIDKKEAENNQSTSINAKPNIKKDDKYFANMYFDLTEDLPELQNDNLPASSLDQIPRSTLHNQYPSDINSIRYMSNEDINDQMDKMSEEENEQK